MQQKIDDQIVRQPLDGGYIVGEDLRGFVARLHVDNRGTHGRQQQRMHVTTY